MRIHELKGYRKNEFYRMLDSATSINEFISKIKKAGYEKYLQGEGLFAGVFAKPDSNTVIKLYYKADAGYEKYLQYALQNQGNPHVPRIIGKPVTFLDKYRIVRMEKLRPYDINNNQDQDTYSTLISLINQRSLYSGYTPSNMKKLTKTYPELETVVDFLAQNHSQLDLHSGNIMFRSNIPVITDPFG